jgi:hypothetical protein
MKIVHSVIVSLVIASLLSLPACSDESVTDITFTPVDLSSLRTSYELNVNSLAHDSMAGRWLQQNGIEKTEKFLKKKFKDAGLQTLEQFPDYTHTFSLTGADAETSSLKINGVNIESQNYLVIPQLASVTLTQAQEVKVTYFNESEALSAQVKKHFDSALANENHLVIIPEKYQAELNKFKRYVSSQGIFSSNIIWLLQNGYIFQYGKNNIIYVIGNNQKNQTVELAHVQKQIQLRNVVGYLKGKSKPDEYIVFSAHMDHLGIKDAENDNLYNGANDNASGTAAVITLAEYFSKANVNERSLIFIGFTAEEKGLLGSKEFVKEFNGISKIQAAINMDMIGNISPTGEGTAFLTGNSRSTMLDVMTKSLEGLDKKIYPEPVGLNLFNRSDNASFFNKGIVSHTISTFNNDDHLYHSPDDEVASINFNSAFKIVETIAQGSLTMVNGTATPVAK